MLAAGLMAISNQTLTAGTSGMVTLMASDPDGDPVTFSAMNLPAYGMLSAGTLTFNPGTAVIDSRMITVTAKDPSNASDSKSFMLTVNPPANQPPLVSMLAQVDAAGATVATGAFRV